MDIAPLLYKNSMIEVKRRFLAIDRILGAKKGNPMTAWIIDFGMPAVDDVQVTMVVGT